MAELWEDTVDELITGYKAKAFSPVDVAKQLLARIGKFNGAVNAFCLIDEETTLAQARASEARLMKGEALSPLDGVPVAIKDLLWTKGWPTLRGSRTVDAKQAWNEDAPLVARLREAGAVFIGKTTTPEYGWKGVTDCPLTGVTRNPWNLKMTPGGSSGGSAAALAARLTPLALGTDGGGSIRIPASFSCVVGLKPTYGMVPAYPLSPFGTLAHVGPMSRDVAGALRLLEVISGFDARDPHAVRQPDGKMMGRFYRGLKGKRVAFSATMGFAKPVDSEVAALVAAAAKLFERLGAMVEEVDPPLFDGGDPKADFKTLWWSGAGYLFGDAPEEKKAQFDPGFRRMVEEGAAISLKRFQRATMARLSFSSAMRQFMERYDFLLTPSVAVPAFEVEKISPWPDDSFEWLSWTPFSIPFNLTQQPAVSVPCGFTRAGLPVGLQIAGRMFDDVAVLAAARTYESADLHHDIVPEGFA